MHLGVVLIGIGVAGLHLAAHATSVPFWGATEVDPQAIGKIQIPAEFVSHVNSILEPGATVLITDEPLSSQTNGAVLQIADADPPNTGHRS
jgi:hypothetical protein